MLAPQCHTVCSHTNISPTRCSRLHVFACVLICISHSLTHHFKNQRRVDLPLNSHQPGAKPLRANGDPVHTDMLVPQRRVMEPAAPLFSAARHAAKTMELCCFLLSCVKCSGQVQRHREKMAVGASRIGCQVSLFGGGWWRFQFQLRGWMQVKPCLLISTKVNAEWKGRWLREKEALDKPHSSGSCASTSPRRVNTVTQARRSCAHPRCVCMQKKKKREISHVIQALPQLPLPFII